MYAIGGFGNEIYLNKVERFNVHTNEWSDIASMQVARRWLAAVVLNDVIYVIGESIKFERQKGAKSHFFYVESA